MKKIIRPFFMALGFISLGLGAAGAVLPLLPTTPFLLLAAFCFARSSTRFHNWLTGTKLYKRNLSDFVAARAMPARTKAYILTSVSVLLPIAMYFAPHPHARIAIGAVLAWHWWYFLFRIKTARPGTEARGAGGQASEPPGSGEMTLGARGASPAAYDGKPAAGDAAAPKAERPARNGGAH